MANPTAGLMDHLQSVGPEMYEHLLHDGLKRLAQTIVALEAHIRLGPTALLLGHPDGASAVLKATWPHWPKGGFLLADAEYDNLAHTAFRPEQGMLAQSTHPLERLNKELNHGTNVPGNQVPLVPLVRSPLHEIADEQQVGCCSFSLKSMAQFVQAAPLLVAAPAPLHLGPLDTNPRPRLNTIVEAHRH